VRRKPLARAGLPPRTGFDEAAQAVLGEHRVRVVLAPSEARALFPRGWQAVRRYLRAVPQPQ